MGGKHAEIQNLGKRKVARPIQETSQRQLPDFRCQSRRFCKWLAIRKGAFGRSTEKTIRGRCEQGEEGYVSHGTALRHDAVPKRQGHRLCVSRIKRLAIRQRDRGGE